MENQEIVLQTEKEIEIRFSEVDSMNIVWHGSYALYLEDAREAFGRKYNLEYLYMFGKGFYAPLVEMKLNYKRPLKYKDKAKIQITYRNTEAAKIIFDYKILDLETEEVLATAHTIQVFLDKDYNLVWSIPDFFLEWKKMNNLI
ncbi:MAG: thioesterase family protein [Bacteroidales bacterium]|jgi:acyl-CoA thioester hydrolase|nr:thioesterase family protein [Bacteroidales bacterium]MDD4702744.1 thioesterase family protein [Bacteroidales bacterium]MDX9798209.1 thioesterase family protein [Bacteroidales bacterium]